MSSQLVQALLSFAGGVVITVLASWLTFRRWKKSVAHDGSREHLVWRYQKQLSCYREFFELWQNVTSESDYVDRIKKTYKSSVERQQSAGRHALRLAAPHLAEFGFVFGGVLSTQAAKLLQGAARSRLMTPDEDSGTDPGKSMLPPQKDELDEQLHAFQKGVISTITMLERLLGLPPRLAAESVPTIAVDKAFAFTIRTETVVSPAPEPIHVPRHSELPR
jgi:hypothetical protein